NGRRPASSWAGPPFYLRLARKALRSRPCAAEHTSVIELAASLPDRMKLRARTTKVILRHAFRDLLPDEIQRRTKMGFSIPLPKWLRQEWRSKVEEQLFDPTRASTSGFAPSPSARSRATLRSDGRLQPPAQGVAHSRDVALEKRSDVKRD